MPCNNLVLAFVCFTTLAALSFAEDCTLKCEHGSCENGEASFTEHLPDGVVSLPFLLDTHEDNMFCQCPAGYTGVKCQYEFVTCQDQKTRCYHGAQCVENEDDNGNNESFCDCSTAKHVDSGAPFAGEYCQHVLTERCNSQKSDETDRLFCVNGGSCKANIVHPNAPCECDRSLWVGPHCEYEKGEKPDCDLDCGKHGKCYIGIKTYDEAVLQLDLPFHEETHVDFKHCRCKKGYTGLQCQVKEEPCGNGKCYNGGTCVHTMVEGGTEHQFCDCTTAQTDEVSFAGDYCEHESTSFCSKNEDHNGQIFCTNHGKCSKDPLEGCICEDGWKGPACEHKVKEPECGLVCENDGKCRKGAKDFGVHSIHNQSLNFLNITHINGEHCICPDGFTGTKCQYEVETCGEGEHICLHGSTCVENGKENDDDIKQSCNCDAAFTGTSSFAGYYCEHESTTICTNNLMEDKQAFCVNRGKCGKNRQSDCECEDPFFGDHCEYKKGVQPLNAMGKAEEGGKSRKGIVIALVVALIAFFTVFVALAVTKYAGRRREKEIDSASPPSDNIAPLGAIFDQIDKSEGSVKGFNPSGYVNKVETPDII